MISKEDIGRLLELARLDISEEEKLQLTTDVSRILEYVDKLSAIDTTQVEPTSQVTGLVNVSRDDEIKPSGIASELVACAPEHQDDYLIIPKIFDNK